MNKKTLILLAGMVFVLSLTTACSHTKKEDDVAETTQPEATVELREKTDAPEIDWLAAEAVLGVSLVYSDFEIEHIYQDEEADIVYTVIKTEGKEEIIKSKPIDGERDKAGSRDLTAEDHGYATFDVISKLPKDSNSYTEKSLEDLEQLLSESLLVTVIEH